MESDILKIVHAFMFSFAFALHTVLPCCLTHALLTEILTSVTQSI